MCDVVDVVVLWEVLVMLLLVMYCVYGVWEGDVVKRVFVKVLEALRDWGDAEETYGVYEAVNLMGMYR